MIRIRFHGRGGHGTKTASRIVGTAAFLSGMHAQDSPVYGAERRGAPVVAYTRVAVGPILERGVIEQPDLIVLADETLLGVPDAGVLANQDSASTIFINTVANNVERLKCDFTISAPVVAMDVTSLTRETLGSGGALSAGLAAAATRMIGSVAPTELENAIREELSHRRLEQELIQKNVAVATAVFDALQPVEVQPTPQRQSVEMVDLQYQHPLRATPSVLHPGNATARKTGSWRVDRPVVDTDVCTRCGLCFARCPDGAIELDDQGYPLIDYDHCKGCMICHQICPLQAISAESETQAW